MKFSKLKTVIPKIASIIKTKVPKETKMKPFNLQSYMGPTTTSQSQASGRLKASVSGLKKRAIIKGAIKKVKLK